MWIFFQIKTPQLHHRDISVFQGCDKLPLCQNKQHIKSKARGTSEEIRFSDVREMDIKDHLPALHLTLSLTLENNKKAKNSREFPRDRAEQSRAHGSQRANAPVRH